MKITLLGSTGYIASHLIPALESAGHEVLALSRSDADYTNPNTLRTHLMREKPAFLINAAGYVGKPNVDACELAKNECMLGNAILPSVISMACAEAGIAWAHISSGCIYEGDESKSYTESDPPNFDFETASSWYSGTKALGELAIRHDKNCYILRLRMPFDSKDSSKNLLSKLAKYDKILNVENSLTCVDDFCNAVVQIIEKQIPFGVYNVVNTGSISTKEIVGMMRDRGIVEDKEIKYYENEQEFYDEIGCCKRSVCVLNNEKLKAHGIEMPSAKLALTKTLNNWTK